MKLDSERREGGVICRQETLEDSLKCKILLRDFGPPGCQCLIQVTDENIKQNQDLV